MSFDSIQELVTALFAHRERCRLDSGPNSMWGYVDRIGMSNRSPICIACTTDGCRFTAELALSAAREHPSRLDLKTTNWRDNWLHQIFISGGNTELVMPEEFHYTIRDDGKQVISYLKDHPHRDWSMQIVVDMGGLDIFRFHCMTCRDGLEGRTSKWLETPFIPSLTNIEDVEILAFVGAVRQFLQHPDGSPRIYGSTREYSLISWANSLPYTGKMPLVVTAWTRLLYEEPY